MKNTLADSPDLNLTTLSAFLRFCAERKAARAEVSDLNQDYLADWY